MQTAESLADPKNARLTQRHVEFAGLAIFALSGCAGLIYQSIWAQYLGLFLGHAAYAQSLVLAIFMGGMALGAWWAGARTRRTANLLLTYAWIELAIGIAAAIFHPVYLAATQFAYTSAFPTFANMGLTAAFKWSFSALLILPQAVLLGATFPLLSNGLMRRSGSGNGVILGGLYFANSIGAAMGALIATFVLLPRIGLPGAMRFGAVLSTVVAATALILSRGPEQSDANVVAADQLASKRQSANSGLLLLAAFITGATSFVYEIGWVRMLSLAYGSTVHAFELMLAAFIGGLAFGSLWIKRRIDGYRHPIRVAGYVQVLMGIAALVSLVLYDRSFDSVAWFMQALSRTGDGYILYNLVTACGAMLIMTPAAFFAGMTLPLFTSALIREGSGEASVGNIYAANTIGAIVGVFAAVHLLVPLLGLKLGMCVAAAGDLALGLVLIRRHLASATEPSYLALLALCGMALAASLHFAQFDPAAMASGVYRNGKARLDVAAGDAFFYRDGKTASIASSLLRNGVATISTNGKPDASIQMRNGAAPSADESTMAALALLPLALHREPQTAAVIGFGSGMTTHTLLGDSRIRQVDTIEIEPAMLEGAKIFGDHVSRAYNDSRSHIQFDDAKAYFAATQAHYDIIISEPSNPWVSGVSNLFSREFYRFVPRHLNQHGLFVQWVQLYEINDELIATVVRALSESFRDFQIYLVNYGDIVIVASPDERIGKLGSEVFAQPQLTSELRRVGLASPADLAIRFIGGRNSLLPLFNALSDRENSDFHPILSLEAPSTRFAMVKATAIIGLGTPDLPYREVIDGVTPPSPSQVSDSQYYIASHLAHQAPEIVAALRGEHSAELDAETTHAISIVKTNIGQCQVTDHGVAETDALRLLATSTIGILDVEGLRGIWTERPWQKCTTQPPALHEAIVLQDALARRDFVATKMSALTLLSKYGDALSPTESDWLLRAAMLSAIATHNYQQVREIEDSLGKEAPPTGTSFAQRVWLLAYADARRQNEASSPGK